MSSALLNSNDLSFDFNELYALKKLALKLVDEVNFYKAGTERNEATVHQLLKEKMELQLQMDALAETKDGCKPGGSESFLDSEKTILMKNLAMLEETNKQQKNTILEQQALLQTVKRDLKNRELQQFQLEAQLADAKSRLEMELSCRKQVTEQVTTTNRVLHDLKNGQRQLVDAITSTEKEVAEACSLNRQLTVRNKFLENALSKAEETVCTLRKRSLSIVTNDDDLKPANSKTCAKVASQFGPPNADERVVVLEHRCLKLQQELSSERKKRSELLESLTNASNLIDQLTLSKEGAVGELEKRLEHCREELEKSKSKSAPVQEVSKDQNATDLQNV